MRLRTHRVGLCEQGSRRVPLNVSSSWLPLDVPSFRLRAFMHLSLIQSTSSLLCLAIPWPWASVCAVLLKYTTIKYGAPIVLATSFAGVTIQRSWKLHLKHQCIWLREVSSFLQLYLLTWRWPLALLGPQVRSWLWWITQLLPQEAIRLHARVKIVSKIQMLSKTTTTTTR